MVKRIFILIYFFISIFIICSKESEVLKNENYFLDLAQKYYSTGKFNALDRIIRIRLKSYPDDYKAAYYRALYLQKFSKVKSQNYYFDFILKYPGTPDEYKIKWFDFSLKYHESKKTKLSLTLQKFHFDEIYINPLNNDSSYCKPKLLYDFFNYYFLDSQGFLYEFNRINKQKKKINYYKTRDFYLLNDYLIFNDSINLIKFFFKENKYKSIFTFNKDEIYILNANKNNYSAIVKYNDLEEYLYKYINLEDNSIIDMPKNYISTSIDYSIIVIENKEKFEIYKFAGELLKSVDGKFLGFGKNSNQVYYYLNKYVVFLDLQTNEEKKIIFIPKFDKFKNFKMIGYDKFLFCFDDYVLIYDLKSYHPYLMKTAIISIFQSGFMYKKESSGIYFFSFLDNSKNLISNDCDILKKMIFSDDNSNIFGVICSKKIVINNLNIFFH